MTPLDAAGRPPQAPLSFARPSRSDRLVGGWLALTALFVLLMAVIGAITRLTGSGLSMVEWRPVLGFLPPMGEAAWQRVFELYKQTPEYSQVNAGMDLAGFKGIFWWEYIHRVWGRLIGLVFALPFAVFWWRGHLARHERWQLLGLLALGAAQGYMGWYMVQSGLVEVAAVSPYRLAAHLLLAVAIMAGLVWLACNRLKPPEPGHGAVSRGRLRRRAVLLLALAVVTVASGALVAGNDAGLVYNTFPLMNGEVFPTGAFTETPAWRNFAESHGVVQFQHRVLAIATAAGALALALTSRRLEVTPRAHGLAYAVGAVALVQVGLGIATLLLMVPVALAAAHQFTALLLIALLVVLLHEVRAAGAPPWRG